MIRLVLALIIFLTVAASSSASAATKKEGLSVSPSRHSVSAKAGETKSIRIKISNNTAEDISPRVHVERFSVADKSKAISFKPIEYDWLSVPDNNIELKANKSTIVNVRTTIPKDAAEGEYYFALFASYRSETKTVRAASLAYIYVDGGNMKRESSIINESIPTVIVSNTVPYSFDIQNTGNIHLQSRVSAYLSGVSWYSSSPDTYQLVIPGQSRSAIGQVKAPFFPGIYTLTYGFSEDTAKTNTAKTKLIVYIPAWSIAALILAALVIAWIRQRHHKR